MKTGTDASREFPMLSFVANRVRAIAVSAAVALSVTPSYSATISKARLSDGTWMVTIDGPIRHGDDDEFFDRMNFIRNRAGTVSSVRLNSPGGLISVGLNIARYIKRNDIMTVVNDGKSCESICFFILMYGNRRLIGRHAKVGIHGASRGGRNAPDVTWHLYEKEMDFFIPEYLGRGIMAIPASEMYYLTIEDLESMGFICEYGVCRSRVPK